MQIGINLPWVNYGWDFGRPQSYNPRFVWQDDLAIRLQDFRDAGISVVRWFILGNGLVLGRGVEAPILERRPESYDIWRFRRCPAPSNEFFADWEHALQMFRQQEIKIIPSLIDFRASYLGSPQSSAGLVTGGRGDVFKPQGIDDFIANVLRPMLDLARDYASQIYAWEIINEPEWILSKRVNGNRVNDVTLEDLRQFLNQCGRTITAAGHAVTIGFVRENTVYEWDPFYTRPLPTMNYRSRSTIRTPHGYQRLNAYFPQFHYYTAHRSRNLPAEIEDNTIVGEFATRPVYDEWPELSRNQSIVDRLALLERKDVDLAVPWSYPEFHDDSSTAEDWAHIRRQIAQYLSSRESE